MTRCLALIESLIDASAVVDFTKISLYPRDLRYDRAWVLFTQAYEQNDYWRLESYHTGQKLINQDIEDLLLDAIDRGWLPGHTREKENS